MRPTKLHLPDGLGQYGVVEKLSSAYYQHENEDAITSSYEILQQKRFLIILQKLA